MPKESTAPVQAPVAPASAEPAQGLELLAAIAEQGVVVRELKANKVEKSTVDAAVAKLLALKVWAALAFQEGGVLKNTSS